jgi:hypothetical protein
LPIDDRFDRILTGTRKIHPLVMGVNDEWSIRFARQFFQYIKLTIHLQSNIHR